MEQILAPVQTFPRTCCEMYTKNSTGENDSRETQVSIINTYGEKLFFFVSERKECPLKLLKYEKCTMLSYIL